MTFTIAQQRRQNLSIDFTILQQQGQHWNCRVGKANWALERRVQNTERLEHWITEQDRKLSEEHKTSSIRKTFIIFPSNLFTIYHIVISPHITTKSKRLSAVQCPCPLPAHSLLSLNPSSKG